MNRQFDLFTTAPPAAEHGLLGLRVLLPGTCRWCGSHTVTIAAGKGPHKAALFCECGRHGGWMSIRSFKFVAEIVRRFGRPTEPIVVRAPGTAAEHVPFNTPNSTHIKGDPMATLNEAFPSKYLKAGDLAGREVSATIANVTFETFENDGRKQQKAVVAFSNGVKPLVCNKTNWLLIAAVTGQDNSDNWADKTIVLAPDMATFQGRTVETIRVRRAPGAAPAKPVPAAEALNDIIPF